MVNIVNKVHSDINQTIQLRWGWMVTVFKMTYYYINRTFQKLRWIFVVTNVIILIKCYHPNHCTVVMFVLLLISTADQFLLFNDNVYDKLVTFWNAHCSQARQYVQFLLMIVRFSLVKSDILIFFIAISARNTCL